MNLYPNELLDRMRAQGDPTAAKAVEAMYQSPKAVQIREALKEDLLNADTMPEFFPKELHHFFEETARLPEWTDWKKVERAHALFKRLAPEVMGMLGSYSLPYCYAAADGARVLHFSEQMKSNTYQRLQETGKFVFDVLEEGSLKPDGIGIRSVQKVRLIHEVIRFHLLKSGRWDMQWGYPVNQEDMAGTNLAFSLIVLRGLRKSGNTISKTEADAYLHFWKVIGHLLGMDARLLSDNSKELSLLARRIEQRQFRESEHGRALMEALLSSFREQVPIPFPKGYFESYMRYLMGDRAGDILGLPPSNWTAGIIQPIKILRIAATWVRKPADRVGEARKQSLREGDSIRLKMPQSVKPA